MMKYRQSTTCYKCGMYLEHSHGIIDLLDKHQKSSVCKRIYNLKELLPEPPEKPLLNLTFLD